MSEELNVDNEFQEKESRPGFLTVLCVLSFISTGLGVLAGLFNLVSGPQSEEAMTMQKVALAESMDQMEKTGMDSFASIMEQIQGMTEDINNNFYLAATINLLIVGAGLFGVIRMFQGLKIGFHIYIAYCLLSVASIYIYVSPAHIPTFVVIFNLFFSGLFIFMYSRNLRWMK